MLLKAPFPYFGGKRTVASTIWGFLGDVDNYIEPFCGSAAVLLARPHPARIETLNDLDCMVANFWRATSVDPQAVAEWADTPVNEADLHARHRWLVLSDDAREFRQRMRTDPEFYDPKVAGWWCWGACCWIGSGWCQTNDSAEWEQRPRAPDSLAGGVGVHSSSLPEKRPPLGGRSERDNGHGVHRVSQQMPTLEMCQTGGKGVNGVGPLQQKRPRAPRDHPNSDGGGSMPGVHGRPQLADAFARGRGVHGNDSAGTCEQRRAWLIDWFTRLRDRLRTVRVCCGHWLRVCDSNSVTVRLGTTGLFLDPPYRKTLADGSENRSANLYANDGTQDVGSLVDEVIAYCLERGSDPRMRIVAACYEGEGYEALLGHGWTVVAWKAGGGYGNRSGTGQKNADRERLFVSPHCVKADRPIQSGLFDSFADPSEN